MNDQASTELICGPDNAVAFLEAAQTALANASSVQDVKQICDQAEAVRIYCRRAKLSLENMNAAAELMIRAQRRGGKILATMDKRVNQHAGNATLPATLSEMGLGKMQSSRWQQIATIPDQRFESFISTAKDTGSEITTAEALRIVKNIERETRTNEIDEMFPIEPEDEPSAIVIEQSEQKGAMEEYTARPEGVRRATEAINALKRISINDPTMDEGFTMVMDYIATTKKRRAERCR